ncbi:hypothetical protein F503_05518 [Ophiostoma piceae UAMH 11346]|uniref:Uncharacterized protein n=1 Tax=Ophiostoma piceae (strain UAMH 11346) TaxID=1262450 RepID=S3CUM1_OPHP1|nr:hypothetical protein F503_05518 [Ophiostoma piceae UAMH 11346]
MTIIGRLITAVLPDPIQPNNGYNNPSIAGANDTPIYYTSGSCGMCANSAHGCRHCRRMTRRDARCVRRDLREMRRAARWDTLLSPVTGRQQQSPQPIQQQQSQCSPMQYSRQQEPAYVPQQYGLAQQQQGRNAFREMSQKAPTPPPRRNSVYDVPAPEGPPPPYALNESGGRHGDKQHM